jgi:hypothetical protein
MISILPVYQLCLSFDSAQDKFGFVFPSEIPDSEYPAIHYCIPITEALVHGPLWTHEFMSHHKIYFPMSINGNYKEVIGEFDFPNVVFRVPDTNYQITFDIDLFDSGHFPFFYYDFPNMKKLYTYIGKQTNLMVKNIGFISLIPIDSNELDHLYKEHNALFVGLTSKFGNEEFLSNNRKQG